MTSRATGTLTRRLISGDSGSGTLSSAKKSALLDQNLSIPRGTVSLDAYLVLFSELVTYSRNRVTSTTELEEKLAAIGYRIGRRAFELVCFREKQVKRENTLGGILHFISTNIWKFLFGKQADALKKMRNSDECTFLSFRRFLCIAC